MHKRACFWKPFGSERVNEIKPSQDYRISSSADRRNYGFSWTFLEFPRKFKNWLNTSLLPSLKNGLVENYKEMKLTEFVLITK